VIYSAVTAECCANDVALALLPHMPELTIQTIHDSLLAEWRAGGVEEADCEYGPPAGMTSWAEHALFTDPVSLDWQELRDLAGVVKAAALEPAEVHEAAEPIEPTA
jgi:hypothetical protein